MWGAMTPDEEQAVSEAFACYVTSEVRRQTGSLRWRLAATLAEWRYRIRHGGRGWPRPDEWPREQKAGA